MNRIFVILWILVLFGHCQDQIIQEVNPNKVQKPYLGYQQDFKPRQSLQTCLQTCGQNSVCLSFCQQKGRVIAIALGTTFAVMCSIVIVCICYNRNLCIYWPCHTYQNLKKVYNLVDSGSKNEKKFNQEAEKIIENFKISQKTDNYFYYNQNKKHIIKCTSVSKKKIKPFLHKFSLKGSDNLSKFTAHGYITCKKGEIFCWFLKIYKQKVKSGQIGVKQNLVYESTKVQQNGNITGKWFYVNLENNAQEWKMQNKQQKQQDIIYGSEIINDLPFSINSQTEKNIGTPTTRSKSSSSQI